MFGSKTKVSNLAGMNTTTLAQITNTIAGISTLNSSLATKANVVDVYNKSEIDYKLLDYPTTFHLESYVGNELRL